MEANPEEAATVAASTSAGSCSSSAAASAGRRDPWAFIRRKLSLNLPPGYHFLPTHTELIVHFLRPKLAGVANDELPLPIFFDEHVIAYRPEDLVEKYRDHGENRWFFFTRRERKHEGGKRPNRTTPGGGHWNATGTWRLIYADGELVGCVGTQVFYETSRKKKKGDEVAEEEDSGKTHWTMYEYESLTSMAQYQANRKGEGNMDELVLCTIQKKKHCAQKKQSKTQEGEEEVDQDDPLCSGNNQNKGRCVGRKGKDQETSHAGGSGENKSSRVVGGSNNKKGRPAVVGNKRRGRNRILAQEQEPEQMEVTLGSEFVNTDPHVNRSNCSVATSSSLPMSYQVMTLFPSAGSTQSHNVHPNHVTHHNLSHQPMELLMRPRPTLQEHFRYEQPYFNPQQHMQHSIMAPPEAYTQGLGLGYSNSNYGQWQPPLWDQHGLP